MQKLTCLEYARIRDSDGLAENPGGGRLLHSLVQILQNSVAFFSYKKEITAVLRPDSQITKLKVLR